MLLKYLNMYKTVIKNYTMSNKSMVKFHFSVNNITLLCLYAPVTEFDGVFVLNCTFLQFWNYCYIQNQTNKAVCCCFFFISQHAQPPSGSLTSFGVSFNTTSCTKEIN